MLKYTISDFKKALPVIIGTIKAVLGCTSPDLGAFLKSFRVFLLALICISLLSNINSAYGQEEVKVRIDSTSKWEKFIPTGIRVGTDAISIVKNFTKSDFKELNFQADIDFYRYFLTLEYGQTERTFASNNAIYKVNGSYFSVGPDINFLHRDPDNNVLFFGIRYAVTNFSDELNYTYQHPLYGDGASAIANNNLKATWLEMVAGMKVRLWKTFWLGYTARFKFGVDTFEQNELIPHYVPGYGRADKRVSWGFNYYILFRIPVRKAPAPLTVTPGS